MMRYYTLLLLLLISTSLQAQDVLEVTVFNTEGEPLEGAYVRGKKAYAVTDANGQATIKKPCKSLCEIEITHISYQTAYLTFDPASNNRRLTVNMTETTLELSEVAVSGYANTLQKPEINSITRLGIPIKELPYTAQVLSSDLIQETQAITLTEALSRATGINILAPTYNNLNMRGFPASWANFLINGQRGGITGILSAPQMTYTIESIEIIKGPASVLNGNAEPGGLINLITKKPRATKQIDLSYGTGSFNFHRASVDATGPIKNTPLNFRAIAGYEHAESFMRFQDNENFIFAPALSWRVNDRIKIDWEGGFYDRNGLGGGWHHFGLLAIDYDLNRLPQDWSGHEPDDFRRETSLFNQFQFQHQLSDNLLLQVQFRHQTDDQENTIHQAIPGSYDPADASIAREYREITYETNSYFANAFLTYSKKVSQLTLTQQAGIDIFRRNDEATARFYRGGVPRLVIDDPQYETVAISSYSLDAANLNWEGPMRSFSPYYQGRLSFNRWNALFGLRFTRIADESITFNGFNESQSEGDQTTSGFTPSAGLSYQLIPNLTLYGNYSTSLQPQLAYRTLANFAQLERNTDPEQGRQFEAGWKSTHFQDKIQLQTAFYHINQTNILGTDPEDPNLLIPIDEATSKGIEVTVSGHLAAFGFLLNYAYNDFRLSGPKQNASLHSAINNPRHNANGWINYSLNLFTESRLKIGFGGNYIGERTGVDELLILPGYFVMDGLVGFDYKKISLNFNLYNIADRRYYTGGSNQYSVFLGNPRNFRVMVRYRIN